MSHLRNIEIKARLLDKNGFERAVEVAKRLCNVSEGEILKQKDVFFKVNTGRLKLRYQGPLSMLIQYDRPNTLDAKLSKFRILKTDEGQLLETMLSESLGVLGIVEKTRTLFWYNTTRLHLDEVAGLGYFFELEVCLKPEESIEDGEKIANFLKSEFGIAESQLMAGAYMDEILTGKSG